MSMYDMPFFPGVGTSGEAGKDGISPTITVQSIEGGNRLIITDASGTKNIDIMNGIDGATGLQGEKGDTGAQGIQGEKGETGAAGKDGISIIKTEIDSNGELIITLSDNSTSKPGIVAGAKGDKGDKGDTGSIGPVGPQGEKGEQGEVGPQGPAYTLTAEDINMIVEAVLAQINNP